MKFEGLKVWRVVVETPGLFTGEVAVKLGMNRRAAKSCLYWLLKTGCATRTGRPRLFQWYATDREPVDTRGRSPNSLANLKDQAGRWAYVVYRRPLIKPNRPAPIAQPSIELERCWPILGVVCDKRGKVRRSHALGGQVYPEET